MPHPVHKRFVTGSLQQATGPSPPMTCSGYGELPREFLKPCYGSYYQVYPPQVVGRMAGPSQSVVTQVDGTKVVVGDNIYNDCGCAPQKLGLYAADQYTFGTSSQYGAYNGMDSM